MNTSNSHYSKKSKFILHAENYDESKESEARQIKRKVQNYDFEKLRTKDQRINDCLEVLKLDKDKRNAVELLIIESGLSGSSFLQKLTRKGYDRQVRDCYRVLKPLSLKKGECVFHQGEIADNFYILVRGKLQILTLKDNDTIEKEKKNFTPQELLSIQAYVNQLQQKKDENATNQINNNSNNNYNHNNKHNNNNNNNLSINICDVTPNDQNAVQSITPPHSPLIQSIPITRNRSLTAPKSRPRSTSRNSMIGGNSQENKDNESEKSSIIMLEESEYGEDSQIQKTVNIPANINLNMRFIKELGHKHKILVQLPSLPCNMQVEEIRHPSKLFSNGVYIFCDVNTIKEGESFGEAGLLMRRVRSATVLCSEDSDLVTLSRQDYNLILKELQHRKQLKKINAVADYMDPNIPFQTASRLSVAMFTISLSFDQSVFLQGESPDYVYFIKKGEVEISYNQKIIIDEDFQDLQQIYSNTNEEHHKLRLNEGYKLKIFLVSCIGNGSFFGEDEIIQNIPARQYNARVKSSFAKIYRIKESEFRFLLSQSLSMREFFFKRIANKEDWRKKQKQKAAMSEEILEKKKEIVQEGKVSSSNHNQITSGIEDIDKMISFCQEKNIITDQNIQNKSLKRLLRNQPELQEQEDPSNIKSDQPKNNSKLFQLLNTSQIQNNSNQNNNHNNKSRDQSRDQRKMSLRRRSSMKLNNSTKSKSKDSSSFLSFPEENQSSFRTQSLKRKNSFIEKQDSQRTVAPQQKEYSYKQLQKQQQQQKFDRIQSAHVTSKRPSSASEVFTSANFIAAANAENKILLKKKLKGKVITQESLTRIEIFENEYLNKVRERLENFRRTILQKNQLAKEQRKRDLAKMQNKGLQNRTIQVAFGIIQSAASRSLSPKAQIQTNETENPEKKSKVMATQTYLSSQKIEDEKEFKEPELNTGQMQSARSIKYKETQISPSSSSSSFKQDSSKFKVLLFKTAKDKEKLRKSSSHSKKQQHIANLVARDNIKHLDEGEFTDYTFNQTILKAKNLSPLHSCRQGSNSPRTRNQAVSSSKNRKKSRGGRGGDAQKIEFTSLSHEEKQKVKNQQEICDEYNQINSYQMNKASLVVTNTRPLTAGISQAQSSSSRSLKSPFESYFVNVPKNTFKISTQNQLHSNNDTSSSTSTHTNKKFINNSSILTEDKDNTQLSETLQTASYKGKETLNKQFLSHKALTVHSPNREVQICRTQNIQDKSQSIQHALPFQTLQISPISTPQQQQQQLQQNNDILQNPLSQIPARPSSIQFQRPQAQINQIYISAEDEEQFQNGQSDGMNCSDLSIIPPNDHTKQQLEKMILDWNEIRNRRIFYDTSKNLQINPSPSARSPPRPLSRSPPPKYIKRSQKVHQNGSPPQRKEEQKDKTQKASASVVNLVFPKEKVKKPISMRSAIIFPGGKASCEQTKK